MDAHSKTIKIIDEGRTMTHIRPELKKNKWKLTKHEFYTAYHYALQYRELKDKYKSIIGLSAINADGMPHGTNTSDPTFSQASELQDLSDRIQLIEDTVKEIDESIYCWLLKGVTTENVSFNYLQQTMHIPCGRTYYYNKRRAFYYLLNKKLNERRVRRGQ